MKRTQIQFTDEQLAWMHVQAAEAGVSISALVRQAVDALIARGPVAGQDRKWERALEIVGAFSADGADVARQHDRYLPDDSGAGDVSAPLGSEQPEPE